MSRINKIIYLIISFVFLSVCDLYLSNHILENVRFNFAPNPIIDLIYVQNTGAAFSILENSQIFLIVFSIIAMLTLLIYIYRNIEKFSTFACLWFAMLVSGIFCNLYERICFGYVRDFFKFNFIEFPVFNISDIFINISVLAIIVIILKNKYLKNNETNG